jgi:hypothetical protein
MPARTKNKPSEPPPARPVRAVPPWLRAAVIGLAALVLIGLFSTQIDDSDFWWHLKTGQYVLQHHTLPSPDPFSYTANAGVPAYPGEAVTRHFNLTHEWLAQVLWYLVYAAGGFPALVLFKALLLAALCGITGILAARRSGSFYAGVAAAFATAAVAVWFASDRPALLTFLFVGVFLLILELRRGLWLLPPLSLVWANSHGGFFLGWIVLGAYVVESVYLRWRKQPIPHERRLWVVAALSVALSFANPNHWRIFDILFLYRRSALTNALVEWKPPPLWGPPYMFDLLLYAAAAVLVLSWRKMQLSDWLLALAFGAAALLAFRNVLLFAVLAPVLIAAYFPWKRSLPAFTGIAVLALLAAGLAAGIASGRFFQLRAAEWQFPSGAARFLKVNHITAPLFNTYEDGGYLIWKLWPDQRVFIDGRALNESVYQDYRRIVYNIGGNPASMDGPRAEALARYRVGAILVSGFSYFTGRLYPLVLALMNSEWKLVYLDPQWMVFLRNPPAGMPSLDKPDPLRQLEQGCLYHIERVPQECICARTLAELLLNSGQPERGRRLLGIYLAHPHPPDPEVEKLYPRLF